jgi:D-amino-acid dehydrogenase
MALSVDVVVVGGGVIGAATAFELTRRGARVLVVDAGAVGCGASYGNAGLVVPSYSVPLANPHAFRLGVDWLLRRPSPVSLHPRLDADLARWIGRFVLACRPSRVASATASMAELGAESLISYERWAAEADGAFGFRRAGWLYVFQTPAGLGAASAEAALLERHGIRSRALDADDVRAVAPTAEGLVGGVHYLDDAQLDPYALVRYLAESAGREGASIRTGALVSGFKRRRDAVEAVICGGEEVRADTFVIAAGAVSPAVVGLLGERLPVEPGRGTSLTVEDPGLRLDTPLSLGEAHVVVTQIGSRVRLTTGMALGATRHDPDADADAARTMRKALTQYLKVVLPDGGEIWSGARPMTPDGLPVIGRLRRARNVILATGHGTLGVSLAPATATRVAELILDDAAETPAFAPARFGL